MKHSKAFVLFIVCLSCFLFSQAQTVIRYNNIGYTPESMKVAVVGSKEPQFRLVRYLVKNVKGGQVVLRSNQLPRDFGAYGPFQHTYRVDISSIRKQGDYQLIVNDSIVSGVIHINHQVYKGMAELCLSFLRNQRCGFNPLMADTCHFSKGYTVGGTLSDSTQVDIAGGWHNPGNFTQYTETAAATTWNLLAAYRDFPAIFNDTYNADGLKGKNEQPDIVDEARWGLDWLIKMNPAKTVMFSQAGDSAHRWSRVARPLYSVNVLSPAVQTGITAAVSNTFLLGSQVLNKADFNYRDRLTERGENALRWSMENLDANVAASNNIDLVLLAARQVNELKSTRTTLSDINTLTVVKTKAGVSPANFLSTAYFEENPGSNGCNTLLQYLGGVSAKARLNAFFNAVPFTNGSNFKVAALANQFLHYRNSCKGNDFEDMEQAAFDWLLGCNPWGVTMVAGLPGISAKEPYGIKPAGGLQYGLVSGPVERSVYAGSKGTSLLKKDAFAKWQSNAAVYHDDRADYLTNQPGLEGTSAMVYLLASRESEALGQTPSGMEIVDGVIVRGDSAEKKIALVFLADKYTPEAKAVAQILSKEKLKASFFLSGKFVKANPAFARQLRASGHYVGPRGTQNIGNCDMPGCDTMMASVIMQETSADYAALKSIGVTPANAKVILPNTANFREAISDKAYANDLVAINATPGTASLKDDSEPGTAEYASSDSIFRSVSNKMHEMPFGLNGFILVFHLDADQVRPDKFYMLMPLLLQEIKNEGYRFVRADEMVGLKPAPVPKVAPKKKPVKRRKRRR